LFKYKLMFSLLFLLSSGAFSADLPSENPPLAPNQQISPSLRIDQLMESAMQKGLISGGVKKPTAMSRRFRMRDP